MTSAAAELGTCWLVSIPFPGLVFFVLSYGTFCDDGNIPYLCCVIESSLGTCDHQVLKTGLVAFNFSFNLHLKSHIHATIFDTSKQTNTNQQQQKVRGLEKVMLYMVTLDLVGFH